MASLLAAAIPYLTSLGASTGGLSGLGGMANLFGGDLGTMAGSTMGGSMQGPTQGSGMLGILSGGNFGMPSMGQKTPSKPNGGFGEMPIIKPTVGNNPLYTKPFNIYG